MGWRGARGAALLVACGLAAACSGGSGHPGGPAAPGSAGPVPSGPVPSGPVPSGSASPRSPSGPATPGASARSFTVVATGDVLVHPPVADQASRDAHARGEQGYDFRPIFAGVKPVIQAADLAICHLETPLGRPGGPFHGYPTFEAPPQVAAAIADSGYDTCSTASNHTLDQGAAGVGRTLAALDAAGVRHAGSARSAREAATPDILDVRGVRVAQLSFAFGFNGFSRPRGKPWLANQIDKAAILGAAHRAQAAGAQVVIVSLHWGTEFQQRPTAQQVGLAHALLASPDIDLIVGHHAHVTQPFERIEGKWVAYGLGNHVAKHAQPRGVTEESVIARFTFTQRYGRWAVTKTEYVPELIDLGPPLRLADLPVALAGPSFPAARRARYQAAYDHLRSIVGSRGAFAAGLAVGR
jgi:poly-gamma-glutamate capsule biosynthesis protein CapA/YwtB (metallophosphatase superfamily)